MFDDDVDSEDELKMMIVKEENREKFGYFLVNEFEYDIFEVVRDDFKLNIYKFFFLVSLGNNYEYDLSDIDEIIVMKIKNVKVKNSVEFL